MTLMSDAPARQTNARFHSSPASIQPRKNMRTDLDGSLRARMAKLMADGLRTQTEPMPNNSTEFAALLDQCRDLADDDVVGKMVLTGWIDHPYGEDRMRCQECMYYLVHRKWCDLPELDLPAEPDWWCRLWRI